MFLDQFENEMSQHYHTYLVYTVVQKCIYDDARAEELLLSDNLLLRYIQLIKEKMETHLPKTTAEDPETLELLSTTVSPFHGLSNVLIQSLLAI